MSADTDWLSACRNAPQANALQLEERLGEQESHYTWLGLRKGTLTLWMDEGGSYSLPRQFLTAVLNRYARPLSELGSLNVAVRLEEGSYLAHMRFLPRFEVIAKDYLIWAREGQEPIGELCAHLLPPLLHLASRAASPST